MSGGSLEIYVLILGFSLISNVPIETLIGYLRAIGPDALADALGVASPGAVADVSLVPEENATSAPVSRLQEVAGKLARSNASPFLLPVALAALLIWLGTTAYTTVASQIAEERKQLTEGLLTSRKELEAQRTDLFAKLYKSTLDLSDMSDTMNDRTAESMFPRCAADLKPGVSDAPLHGFGA